LTRLDAAWDRDISVITKKREKSKDNGVHPHNARHTEQGWTGILNGLAAVV
jgi:hypothetical protein